MTPLRGSVSWTGKPVSYYLHVIDRTKLEKYFHRLKNPKEEEGRQCRSQVKKELSKQLALDTSSNDSKDRDDRSITHCNDEGGFFGPTTRRAWSDWCSGKNKIVRSNASSGEEESTKKKITNGRRKVSTRRRLSAASLELKRGPGRPKKAACGRNRKKKSKNIRISGLDLLHSQTILSTSPQATFRRPPPAPGCVDQKLSSIRCGSPLLGAVALEPLNSPGANISANLEILMESFRNQYLQFLQYMRTPQFHVSVREQCELEKERHSKLTSRAAQLEKQVKVLIEDSVALLKLRMLELGIQASTPTDLLTKAKEIVLQHKQLQAQANTLQGQVASLETEHAHLTAVHRMYTKPQPVPQVAEDLKGCSPPARESLLREISSVLSRRKTLCERVGHLNSEVRILERVAAPRGKENERLDACTAKLGNMDSLADVEVKTEDSSDGVQMGDEQAILPKQEWSLPVRIPLKDVSGLEPGLLGDFEQRRVCGTVSSKDSGIASADSQTGSERDAHSPLVGNAYSPISRPSSTDSLAAPSADYLSYAPELPVLERDELPIAKEELVEPSLSGCPLAPDQYQSSSPKVERSELTTDEGDNARACPMESKKPICGGNVQGPSGGLILNLGSLLASAVKAANLKAEEMRQKKMKRKPSPAVEEEHCSSASHAKKTCQQPDSSHGGNCGARLVEDNAVIVQERRTSAAKSEVGSDKRVSASPSKHWQAKVSSGFDRLVAFASTAIDRSKEMRRRSSMEDREISSKVSSNAERVNANTERVPKSAMHRQWVVDAVVNKDRTNTHAKDNTLSLKFKVVHTKEFVDQGRKSSTSSTEDPPFRCKGPRTPPDTPPRTPSPEPLAASSANTQRGPFTPVYSPHSVSSSQSDASPSCSPKSQSCSPGHRDNAEIQCLSSSRKSPPPCESYDTKSDVSKSPYDRHFKKKFVHKGRNWSTKYQSKFRPKGKDWDWNQSSSANEGSLKSGAQLITRIAPLSHGNQPQVDSDMPSGIVPAVGATVSASASHLPAISNVSMSAAAGPAVTTASPMISNMSIPPPSFSLPPPVATTNPPTPLLAFPDISIPPPNHRPQTRPITHTTSQQQTVHHHLTSPGNVPIVAGGRIHQISQPIHPPMSILASALESHRALPRRGTELNYSSMCTASRNSAVLPVPRHPVLHHYMT